MRITARSSNQLLYENYANKPEWYICKCIHNSNETPKSIARGVLSEQTAEELVTYLNNVHGADELSYWTFNKVDNTQSYINWNKEKYTIKDMRNDGLLPQFSVC